MKPAILTIGIPTYNRAYSLKNTLPRLSEDLVGLESRIQILIVDNASTDDTQQVVNNWIDLVKNRLKVKYVRNNENIGMSRNIVSCFYLSDTPYTTFMGDDDCLSGESLIKLIRILEGPEVVSAVIGVSRSKNYSFGRKGYITYEEAASWFYIYGNGSEGIVNTKAAIASIEKRNLRTEIEKIVWPQTVMGFLAMFDKMPTRVYAADFSITDSFSDYQNVTNKAYWVKCFDSFLKAAVLVDRATKRNTIKKSLLRYKNSGFYSHIRVILWYGLIADAEVSTLEIRKILRQYYGVKGFFWSFIILLSDHKRILVFCSRLLYVISKRKSPSTFDTRLKELNLNYLREVTRVKESKKRFGDWF